jgi:hypothetical protein
MPVLWRSFGSATTAILKRSLMLLRRLLSHVADILDGPQQLTPRPVSLLYAIRRNS